MAKKLPSAWEKRDTPPDIYTDTYITCRQRKEAKTVVPNETSDRRMRSYRRSEMEMREVNKNSHRSGRKEAPRDGCRSSNHNKERAAAAAMSTGFRGSDATIGDSADARRRSGGGWMHWHRQESFPIVGELNVASPSSATWIIPLPQGLLPMPVLLREQPQRSTEESLLIGCIQAKNCKVLRRKIVPLSILDCPQESVEF